VSTSTRPAITMERIFTASVDDVWELWTTKDGIEAWWGPGGFRVEVRRLELWAGGALEYAMIACEPETIAFMKQAGMPIASEARATYTEVTPKRRLTYDHHTDFIPGITPYQVAHTVELFPTGDRVRMVLTFDPMHDDVWTQRQSMGWASELDKLERLLAARRA